MIEDLISRVFYARNVAHFAHWRATGAGSYAEHMALGSFYSDVIDALDQLVEAYQGANKIIGDIPSPGTADKDVIKLLTAHVKWAEEHREDITKGSNAVANLLDGVVGVYLSTLYKLRNLQ